MSLYYDDYSGTVELVYIKNQKFWWNKFSDIFLLEYYSVRLPELSEIITSRNFSKINTSFFAEVYIKIYPDDQFENEM